MSDDSNQRKYPYSNDSNPRKRKISHLETKDRQPKRPRTDNAYSQHPVIRNTLPNSNQHSRASRPPTRPQHTSENSRGAGNLQDLKRQALQEKRDEITRLEKNLADFQKERDYLLDNKEYFAYSHFTEFFGHRQLPKHPSITNVRRPITVEDRNQNSVGDFTDLEKPHICSRFMLGIAPVFGPELIFETPLASLAMSSSTLPESLPQIEELERRKRNIEVELRELQEHVGKKLNHVPEPPRAKTPLDHLLGEMKSMAEEFVRENIWKKNQRKKLSKAVLKHFEKEETKRKNKIKIENLKLKKIANTMCKEVCHHWTKIAKIVRFGQDIDQRIENAKISNEKLETLVKQTEGYSAELVQELKKQDTKEDEGYDGKKYDRDSIGALASKMQTVAKNRVEVTQETQIKIPHLLRFGQLRSYQVVGLDWLAALHRNGSNGILADEMGLGKTIQTIALLAHLAVEEEIWGPHLIVVPASVLMNWEMEFKRWCPAFKILSYHGTKKERQAKRQGWSKDNAFHVCITSYNLVTREAKVFRRKRWQYLVLDEAHQIKNYKSARWQTLLKFNTQDRLLLTGTPLQNNMLELWSLLHFLMPNVFESQSEFVEWFENPVNGMINRNEDIGKSDLVKRLHTILRPFLLRRQKKDVEKQLPPKKYHTYKCRLSRRQRRLYEDFMRTDRTKKILSNGDFMGMMNIVMQLRKVCNHPDLFEGRAIRSPFTLSPLRYTVPSLVANDTIVDKVANSNEPLIISKKGNWQCTETQKLQCTKNHMLKIEQKMEELCPFPGFLAKVQSDLRKERKRIRTSLGEINSQRCRETGYDILDICKAVKIRRLNSEPHIVACEKRLLINEFNSYPTNALLNIVKLPWTRHAEAQAVICKFVEYNPPVETTPIEIHSFNPPLSVWERQHRKRRQFHLDLSETCQILHNTYIRRKMNFPELRLLQWDCGKLQMLDKLLRQLKEGGHRVLIFTQMSKMLNVLESFLNLHRYRYLRLDGSTKTEDRGKLMHRFNVDTSIDCFILSTRSGGLGMNLTGADTVIFYDNDWNPAMDLQAQDRCHRIGQKKEVHIYKLCSENTIEENILKKAEQKLQVMDAVMGEDEFNLKQFRNISPWEILGLEAKQDVSQADIKQAMELAEDVEDRQAARSVMKEVQFTAEMDVLEYAGDEYREKVKFETAIDLLNPVEKYSLSFFGQDRRPDPALIFYEELRCRQLDVSLDNDLRFLRNLTYFRKGQELTKNASTELEHDEIEFTTSGVHFEDVVRLAHINFKEKGYKLGNISLLVSDDNTRDWGLFATQKEIDMMIPPPKTRKRKRMDDSFSNGKIVKKLKKEQAINMAIRIDDQLNIHIPWSLLPSRKQPVNLQKQTHRKAGSSKCNVDVQPKQKSRRKRHPKDAVLPFNNAEEEWLKQVTKNNTIPKLIALNMETKRKFCWKYRNVPKIIEKKLSDMKNNTKVTKKTEPFDTSSHDALTLQIEGNSKFIQNEQTLKQQIIDSAKTDSNANNENAYKNLIEKAKQRAQTVHTSSLNPQMNQHRAHKPLTPVAILKRVIESDEQHKTHMNLMRANTMRSFPPRVPGQINPHAMRPGQMQQYMQLLNRNRNLYPTQQLQQNILLQQQVNQQRMLQQQSNR